jgi:serine/threonine-protein kinase
VGTLLREKYRLEQVLAVGGMATVYRAIHRTGNRVAVKVLRPELSVDDDHRDRFIREAYVANSLDHPGAVRVLDDDIAEDGCPFLVMELLTGETLEARHRRCGRLPAREVLTIAHALCDVLARAHERGVIHRDIKPENIFLTAAGELKVLDFGIARVSQVGRDSGTQTGHLMGTPAYMPPEQALGRHPEIDGRTDLWAVGATMFTLLSGRVVHVAKTSAEAMIRSATLPAPPLAELVPELPAALTAVVDHALAFEQADRFPDARAMQSAIAAAHLEIFGTPIEAVALPTAPAPETLPGPARPVSEAAPTLAAALTAAEAGNPSRPTFEPQQSAIATRDPPRDSAVITHDPTLHSAAHDAASHNHSAARSAAPDRSTARDALADTPTGAVSPREPAPPRKRSSRALGLGLGLAATALLASFIALVVPSSMPAAAGACTSNAACIADAGGAPAICRKDQGRCVPLTSERCHILADPADLEDDATLWIGAMYAISDPASTYGQEALNFIELARRDFAGLTGGIPATTPGGRARPIGVIACDDHEDHARIAAHLVDTVGVPAILGFGRSKEVLELANQFFVPRGVLALASNTASMLASIPHPPGTPRLVYRVTTSADMVSPPTAALVRTVLERDLRAPGGALEQGGPLRIAVVRSSNASGTSHTDALFTALTRLRPGPARDELRQFVVEDDRSTDPVALRRVADEVAAFAPHIVLDGGAPATIPRDIERAWTHGPRPDYSFGSLDPEVALQVAREQPDFHRRFHIIETRSNPTMEKVIAHYRERFPSSDPRELSPSPYDAFYVLAYAAIALGEQPITGRALAGAIARLVPPGEPIDVGPAGIYPALKVLSRGGNIDLRGTLMTLDFDPETGDATADFAVFCIDPTGAHRSESGVVFDAATRQLVGATRCP